MGGRGASSGVSTKGKRYGSQYHTRLEVGNIKFVSKNTRQSEDLLETMTKGRIYVTVGGKDDLIRITFFDNDNKRNRVLEKDKRTGKWHTHEGYLHTEYSEELHGELTSDDRKLLDRVTMLWNNNI